MFLLAQIALGSGIMGASLLFVKHRKPICLVDMLSTPEQTSIPKWRGSGIVVAKREIENSVAAIEDRYQRFIQEHIDPLFGKTRQMQLERILPESKLELSSEERYANLRIGIGGLALGTALLGQFVYAPLMIIAILLGFSMIWTFYYIAYLEWQRTRRLGALHLTCVYDAFLWFGGYASIGALGALLIGIGLKTKAITENQSRHNLTSIFQLQPSKVWVRSDGIEVEISFDQLQTGDILVLQAGQIVPVDGTIVAGTATVDQHMLTGESQPAEKSLGEEVLAATWLISGKIDIRVEKTGTETTAGQLGEILNQTAQYNASTTLKVMEITDRFAWPTLALSAASWPVLGWAGAVSIMGANSTFNTYISGSLVVLNFLNLAAERGILVKDCKALEQLNNVDTIIFDKTGTLTLEQPHVVQVHTLTNVTEEEVLALAAAAEARQTHPIARAILTAAEMFNVQLPSVDEAHYEVGFGLKVRLESDDKLLRVGSGRFMKMEGIVLPEEVDGLTTACQDQGQSLVMVAVDDVLIGCVELQSTIRPEAQQIVQRLQKRGLTLYIISGDQEAPTRKLAADLGMTGYFANTLPEAKADLVAQLQEEGRCVCFIGDGINDAIAMRKAEVSISLLGAATAATDTAQIILMEGNLNRLFELFVLAEKFERNLKRNFQFTAGVSIVAVAGILLAGFTFAATEILYAVSLLGGLGIAMKPLLNEQHEK